MSNAFATGGGEGIVRNAMRVASIWLLSLGLIVAAGIMRRLKVSCCKLCDCIDKCAIVRCAT